MSFRGVSAVLAVCLLVLASGCGDLLGSGGGRPGGLEGTSPAHGQTDVSVLSEVQLFFDKKVKLESAAATVLIWNGPRAVMVTPELGPQGNILILKPDDPFDFGTNYRVEVSELLRFRGGGSLSNPTTWEFTTEGLPPPVPNQDSLYFHLEALAHDSMRGRGSGSVDELKAAEYLADLYLSYGLQEAPGGAIQSFQAFSNRQDRVLDSRNVLAVLEGSGALADEFIVVGAHYDHIGFRNLPDESQGPNNGADDNGSGTVLILEMARILQDYVDSGGMASRDRRAVVFAGWGAEEDGLHGSCSYVYENPAVALAETKAVMNFDMVGRLRDQTVYLSGGETSDLWAPLAANSNSPDLSAPLSTSSCTGCTDHVCFWREGVPFLGFFTGLHDQYHAPGDDVETINFPGLVQVGTFAVRALSRLMVIEDPPTLTGSYPTG
jgi:hypothetical protein